MLYYLTLQNDLAISYDRPKMVMNSSCYYNFIDLIIEV